MARRVKECEAAAASKSQQKSIADFAHGSTYTPADFRTKIAIWVARRHRPFTIIEDPELQDLFRMLYARVKIPSRHTVARDMRLILEDSKARLIMFLKVRLTVTRDATA